MDAHSNHMNLETEGVEREREAKAIAAQHKADLEHLRNNVHPSLRDSVTLGDASDGTCGSISDYAVLIFKEELATLKAQMEVSSAICADVSKENAGLRDSVVCLSSELATLKQNFEALRLQVLADATPETPADVFAAVPGIGAKAEEFAPVNNSAPTPTEAPIEAPKVQQ